LESSNVGKRWDTFFGPKIDITNIEKEEV